MEYRFIWDVDVDAVNEPSQTWDVLNGKQPVIQSQGAGDTMSFLPCYQQ